MTKYLALAALVLAIAGCGGKTSDDSDPTNRKLDLNDYPTINSTIYGGWDAGTMHDRGIIYRYRMYFSQKNRVGAQGECIMSDGQVLLASTWSKAVITGGSYQILETASGTATGVNNVSCSVSLFPGLVNYAVYGDTLQLNNPKSTNGPVTFTRIR
jgi:hypothetical protein